jgi:putative aminopeptidase FrvX
MELKDLYVDLGVASKKEVLDLGINVGDSVIPYTEFMVMNNPDYLCSKAFDDRIGAAIVVEVMRNLKGKKIPNTLYSVGSVQEEVGLRGAKTATYRVKPDVAIAIDVSMSYDVPGSSKGESKLGKGVALSLMDSSVIANRGLFKMLRDICIEKNIPFTYDSLVAGGTDSGEINKSFDGVINMTLSLPCRYFHSHNSIVSLTDYNACIDLLTEFVLRLDEAKLEEIKNSKK